MAIIDKTGADDYQQAFYAAANGYNDSAELIAKCNIRLDEGLKLQRKLIENHKPKE